MPTPTEELLAGFDRQHAEIVAEIAAGRDRATREVGDLTRRFEALTTQNAAIEKQLGDILEHGGGAPSPRATGSDFGRAVTAHADFPILSALAGKRGKHTLTVRAALTTAPGSGGALTPADRRTDPVTLPQNRLTIRDLVAPGSTSATSVEYAKQTLRDLNARIVSEGAAKPESNLAYTIATAPVVTLAHWTKASRQILADAPALRTMLDGELRYGIRLAEESEMLFGDSTSGHMYGIIPQATAYEEDRDAPGDTPFDTLAHAIAQSEVALLPATGIVMNTDDLEALKVIKDDQGRYIGGGPFGPPITTIWGRPVVGTSEIEEGDFLVGAFRDGAQIFDREEVNLLISTENEDDFIKNLCTALAEERLAFTVRRPQAFVYGQFPTGT